MGKYTTYGGGVDTYIEKNYLQKIIESFKKDIGENLVSIILFGGFGKGEGSFEIIDNKPVPFNDFDFYIVTSEKLSEEELNKISHNASHSINVGGLEIAYFPHEKYDKKKFFHIDVRCIPYNILTKLMKTQRYYELKNKSIVIEGDETIVNNISEIKPEDIPDDLKELKNLGI